ncbi:uncharacterized protein LOC110458847 [Mizuhopecten yessoensis]|uniref:Voltage-dependent calcium channel gamma-8 subunit n=1 Tax=Mizuhopecten yessoensis TaxID=6573 RepID=A0A210Q5Q2_MIZYE|nr:uncharacterized protein LOC110458847 [Mizuhopecten yessoensis]XP_021366478.1 uncharacterized protein LOC110458847 [Mizuhopecten yessoensis]OWF44058.1 Voltage-dependent calcium channel gamma-8 subunit [Mizuhopecten yessoensis]
MRKTGLAMSRAVSLTLCVLAGVCTLFQLISFATQGWGIWTDKITGRKVYIGLWYSVVCDAPSGYCASISHHEEHQKNVDNNQLFKEPQYALRVWGQVIVTFAVLFCLIGCACVTMSCRMLRHKRRLNIGSAIALVSSGFLMLSVIGHWTADLSTHARIRLDNSRNIYHFPWSLLLGGLGGILALAVGATKLLLLCAELQPGEDGQGDHTYIPMTQQNSVPAPGIPEEGVTYPAQDSFHKDGEFKPTDNYKAEYPSLDMSKPQLITNCDQQNNQNDCSVKCML